MQRVVEFSATVSYRAACWPASAACICSQGGAGSRRHPAPAAAAVARCGAACPRWPLRVRTCAAIACMCAHLCCDCMHVQRLLARATPVSSSSQRRHATTRSHRGSTRLHSICARVSLPWSSSGGCSQRQRSMHAESRLQRTQRFLRVGCAMSKRPAASVSPDQHDFGQCRALPEAAAGL